ncbi:heptosyltransferase-2 [Marinospirillum celere]|uniref:lipopolysaccharide heptosyltransferase II n=1 Tax=Marinospirillum celere TaxID=1122252 RepID=A0A1I1HDD0_9GAMM|nr:lipopolysaccharide heptosyltransferase II [Marinospirillum celere]SFC21622.1 heptosyltransferase-2 [Marinospirillum celere]
MSYFFRKAAGRNLVLTPATVQKLLLALPTLADIKQRYPSRPLDIMVPTRLAGLAARFPQVDAVYNLPEPNMSWKTFWRAGLEMQDKDHAHAWVLPDRFKPALIPMLANIAERTGYRGRYRYSLLIDIRLPNKKKHPHLVDRYRALAWDIVDDLPEIATPSLASSVEQQQAVLDKFELQQDRPSIIFCPGSVKVPGVALKQQPEAHEWQALLDTLVSKGWQVWLLASHNEKLEVDVLLDSLAETTQAAITNLAGKITWEEAVDLVHLARATVALDNALALVAQACGLPVYLPVKGALPEDTSQWLAPALGAKIMTMDEVENRLVASKQ